MGLAFGTASEDMDSLTFGTNYLLRGFNSKKEPICQIEHKEILAGFDMTQAEFVDLCILCGCDYTQSIGGLGACVLRIAEPPPQVCLPLRFPGHSPPGSKALLCALPRSSSFLGPPSSRALLVSAAQGSLVPAIRGARGTFVFLFILLHSQQPQTYRNCSNKFIKWGIHFLKT